MKYTNAEKQPTVCIFPLRATTIYVLKTQTTWNVLTNVRKCVTICSPSASPTKGVVVFSNVLAPAECERSVDEVWQFVERHTSARRLDPKTWDHWTSLKKLVSVYFAGCAPTNHTRFNVGSNSEWEKSRQCFPLIYYHSSSALFYV